MYITKVTSTVAVELTEVITFEIIIVKYHK